MMKEYRFDQIAIVSTEKKKPTEKDKANYVGLEHLSPDTFDVTEYGSEVAPKGEKLVMRKGDVLFGKRRAYQKKVGIAPCDGIFSAHGMVLRPNEDVADSRFFPFFIKSDCFLDEAIRISVGSLSPTVNWRDLRELRFRLPSLERQRELAEILCAGEDLKSTYRQLLFACDEQVKSRFVEMFGEYESNELGWPKETLGERIRFLTSGSRGWAKYYSDDGELFITIKNVKGCKIHLDDVQHVIPPQGAEAERTRVQTGDLLVSVTADLGRTGVVNGELAQKGAYINQHLMLVRLDRACYNPLFVAYFMESPFGKEQFAKKNMTSVKAGLNFDSMKSFRLFRPPISIQDDFVSFVSQVDKSEYVIAVIKQ